VTVLRLGLRRVDVVASWRYARAQFAALMAERDALKQELAETQQALCELQAAVLERTQAFYELRHLQRERDIVRARHAERDWDRPLH
jgi:hypothetical protein